MMLLFASLWGLDGVWASLPASDFVAFLVAVVIMQRFKMTANQSPEKPDSDS
jgi:Na+-driven multidrug efflux pump